MAARAIAVGALLASASALQLGTISGHADDELTHDINEDDKDVIPARDLPDDPFEGFYVPLGETARPRMLAMRGCSGSSAIMVYARNLLRFHGIPVSRAAEPNFDENHNPLSPNDETALPAELLNPKINWLYSPNDGDIGKAMVKMNENVNVRNQTLFFKGMIQHLQGDALGQDEWHELKNSLQSLNMYAVLGSRTNMLDQVICQVKDCFQDEYGYPVNADSGERSDLCFSRRGEQVNPTATNQALVNSKQAAELETMTELEIAMNDSAWFWNGGDEYKAKLDIDHLMHSIAMEYKVVSKAQENMESIGLKFETISEEDLLEFQTPIDGAFGRGVDAWCKVLESFGVEPNRGLVKTFLSKYAQTYHMPPAHWEVIYNYDEVEAALKGSEYEHLLRW